MHNRQNRPIFLVSTIALILGFASAGAEAAADPPAPPDQQDGRSYQVAIDRAINFLRTKGQEADGSYAGFTGPGVTAVVATGILRNGRSPNDPMVAKSLKYLEGFIKPDGGIYQSGTLFSNYETCLGVLAFSEANRDGRYDKLLKDAERFLKGGQWDEGEDKDPTNYWYGGAGYGSHGRPDLSNTQFLIDALVAVGNGPEDEAIQKALIFVSRCQNLESEHNTTRFAPKINDGGLYYTCVLGREDESRQTADGGMRSYGAMTYAGLKSMIYAGLSQDDPRVKAAVTWVRKHYDLKSNPGMGDAGLYYYYHTFAKALDAWGVDEIEDAKGIKHDWRRELTEELARRQQPDGSWVNKNRRWMEGDPNLATAFALLALSYCRPQAD